MAKVCNCSAAVVTVAETAVEAVATHNRPRSSTSLSHRHKHNHSLNRSHNRRPPVSAPTRHFTTTARLPPKKTTCRFNGLSPNDSGRLMQTAAATEYSLSSVSYRHR